jgi:hypothetical protein
MADLEIQNLETGCDHLETSATFDVFSVFPNIELIASSPRWRAILHLSPAEIVRLLDRFGLEIRPKEIKLDKP